ncbi:hypothetical protein [Paenibacillus lautus]|uniref:hypothetical protein n=1 Tax=Paenibacillus lautus TaxID=1401 RepID=UPI003D9A2FF6
MEVQKITATRSSLPAAAQYARLGFSILNVLFAICIALQVFLAGFALFVDSSQWGSFRKKSDLRQRHIPSSRWAYS